MLKISTNKVSLFIIIFTFYNISIFAQDPGDIGNDPGAPAAPIDNWISITVFLAIAMAFYLCNKKRAKA